MAKTPVRLSPVERADKKTKNLLRRLRERFIIMDDADDDNRRYAVEDLEFVNVPGQQWDKNMTNERGDRPILEFNKLRINGKRVINEIRANRPQGKVRATEGGDKDTADLYEGLIRNIWASSDGDTIIDTAAEYQVDAGMTGWRVVTEYSDDTAFDQDIRIEAIRNPLCLWVDPACQDILKRDAEDWILSEKISTDKFEARYPDADEVSWDEGDEWDDQDDWDEENSVRIAEYWYKEPIEKEIWLLQRPNAQGEIEKIAVDSTSDEAEALKKQPGFEQMIIRTRTVKTNKIMMIIASGSAILEGPTEWAGSMFPFVMIYGEYKIIDGKPLWWGLHRFAKDAQRSYNVSRTAIDEAIAGAPKNKWWATAKQAKGNLTAWARAHKENKPFMLYNHDEEEPGAPKHMPGADVPIALIQQASIAAQDIRDTTGLHEAAFGEESNEHSGIALARKQAQGQVVTFNYPDNMSKGIKRTWEILIDLIPHVYDSERELRIIGSDDSVEYKTVHQLVVDPETGAQTRINDVSVGSYDVAITTGPSYSTMRQEAAEVYGNLAAQNPEFLGIAGDLVFKSLDYPYAEDIAERWETLLPPQIQQMIGEGAEQSPEIRQAMQQVQQRMQQVEEQGQLVQAAGAEVQQDKALADKAKSEVQMALADLAAKKSEFQAEVTKKFAELAKQMAQFSVMKAEFEGEATQAGAQANVDMRAAEAAQQAVEQINQMVGEFMKASALAMQQIEAMSGQINIHQPRKPLLTELKVSREDGKMVGTPQYDGDSDEPQVTRIESVRNPDGTISGKPFYE